MNDEHRRPNWDKWTHIPDLRVWQAVALSLDIDPDKARYCYNSIEESHLSDECPEFLERVDVATANVGRAGGLTPVRLHLSDRSEHTVSLTQFARWAQSVGWSTPAGLAACASDKHADLSRTEHDLDGWKRRRLWTLLEAAHLIVGQFPPTHAVMMLNVFAGPVATGSPAEIYNDLKDAIDLHEIEFVESRTDDLARRRVKPEDCIRWAKARGYTVPAGLADLAIGAAPSTRDSPDDLNGKERTTAYKLILGMAMAGFDFDPKVAKSDAANRISRGLEVVGIRLTDETVLKWLRKAAAQLDRAG